MSKEGMYICAELGVNWNGDKKLLYKMAEDCAKAGVDAIKLQLFHEDVLKDYPEDLRKKLTPMILDVGDVVDIAGLVRPLGVEVIVTPFYLSAFKMLKDAPIDGIKIRAKDWWKYEFHNATRDWDIPVYTSVPYNMGEIDWSGVPEELRKDKGVSMLSRTRGRKRYRVYCIPKYPPRKEELNLYMVPHFDGVSLHSPDWYDHYAAACINIEKQYDSGQKRRFYIEVHVVPNIEVARISLDSIVEGRDKFIDGAVSLYPSGLRQLVKACYELEDAIG